MALPRFVHGGTGLVFFAVITAACGSDPTGGYQADGAPSDERPQPADAGANAADGRSDDDDGGVSVGDGGVSVGDGGFGPLDGGTGQSDGGSPLADAGGTTTTAQCSNGPGQALWRLSFPSNGGGYATVDEWANGCDYSLADQACSLSGEPHDDANWGPGVLFNSSTDYFRVRFSAAGLDFSQATLYLSAHADGSGIPNARLESPIYGSLSFAPTVPISTHRTYAVDWSDFLSPSDSPSLTAVTLRSNPTGLAVSQLELCVE